MFPYFQYGCVCVVVHKSWCLSVSLYATNLFTCMVVAYHLEKLMDTTEMVLFFCPHQLYLSSISFSNVSCPANGAHSGPVLVPSWSGVPELILTVLEEWLSKLQCSYLDWLVGWLTTLVQTQNIPIRTGENCHEVFMVPRGWITLLIPWLSL